MRHGRCRRHGGARAESARPGRSTAGIAPAEGALGGARGKPWALRALRNGGAQLSVALDESWPGASEKFLADRDDALCAYGCDIVPSVAAQHDVGKIGRASCRERVCQYA